jgi:hypothetical protein
MQRVLITMFVGLGLAACAADSGDEAILITKNVVPGEDCAFSSSPGEQALLHGTVAKSSKRAYRMFPQLQSRITATTGHEDQRTILLKGAHVDVEDANSHASLASYDSLFAAPLAPNGGITDGGFDAIPVDVINGTSGRVEVIVKATVFGDLSGSDVTSQEYQYPVTICDDCVVNNLGACPLAMAVTNVGNPCNPYQDGMVDCCMGATGLQCPATVAAP